MKAWYKSRTIWFNALSLVVMILSLPEVAGVMPQELLPWLALAVALGNLALRKLTTKAIG